MKTSTIVLVVAGVGIVAVVLYFAMQRSEVAAGGAGDGQSAGSIAGLIRSIGAGLTGITATVVGAVESENARADAAAADTVTEEAAP